MSEKERSVAEVLAARSVALRAGDVPAPVRERCEDLLIDVAGLCVAARNQDYVLALKRSLDRGECTAIGHAETASADSPPRMAGRLGFIYSPRLSRWVTRRGYDLTVGKAKDALKRQEP